MVAASPEPGQVRAQGRLEASGGRLETVPAALTLYDIEADGRLRSGAIPLFLTATRPVVPNRQAPTLAARGESPRCIRAAMHPA